MAKQKIHAAVVMKIEITHETISFRSSLKDNNQTYINIYHHVYVLSDVSIVDPSKNNTTRERKTRFFVLL